MLLMTVSGGAGAGKTTLARTVAELSALDTVAVIHGDDFYFSDPSGGVWRPDQNGILRLDVGDPMSVDFERLDRAVDGLAVPIVIVEGMFAFRASTPPGAGRVDVFVDVPADLRLARKIERKCVAGDFPLVVLLQNYPDRREAHERYVEPARRGCHLVVDGTRPAHELALEVLRTARSGAARAGSVAIGVRASRPENLGLARP